MVTGGPAAQNWPYIGSWAAAVLGASQTISRAELWPAIILAENSQADATLYSDSAYVVGGYASGRHWCPGGSNADLWELLGAAVRARTGSFAICKVKAHRDLDDLAYTDPDDVQHYTGNAYADSVAVREAGQCQLDADIVAEHRLRLKMASAIQRRIAFVLPRHLEEAPKRQWHPLPEPAARAAPVPLPQRLQEISLHPHRLWEAGSGHLHASCDECGQTSPATLAHLWLISPCQPARALGHGGGARGIATDAPQVGRRRLHASHLLATGQGYVWCVRCAGCCATEGRTAARKLGSECVPHLTPGGRSLLKRLAAGMPPYGANSCD